MKTLHEIRRRCHNNGFSRIDLLAVIGAVGVMMAVIFPALGRTSQRTAIVQCASNLKAYDLALQIYGNENNGKLPVNTSGYWAWDVTTALVNFLLSTGIKPAALYCPGLGTNLTSGGILDLLDYWESEGYASLGYASTLPGTASFAYYDGFNFQTNLNTSLGMQRYKVSANLYYPVQPATRVLVADATMSTNVSGNPAVFEHYSWTGYDEGYPIISAHVAGAIPLGGNIGMLDGHVEWRAFGSFYPRAGDSVAPFFYY